MKMELINKLKESCEKVSENGPLMEMAEKILNDEDLSKFASSILEAYESLESALKLVEGVDILDEQALDELGVLASSFDESGDPILQKQASVLDEIILTIGADPKAQMAFKKAQDDEIERLRAKYKDSNRDEYTKAIEQSKKEINVNEAIKEIDKRVKKYRPLEASLSTRYSPDMPGVSMIRIGENIWQCPISKKIYDFRSGYTTAKGNVVPGSDVSNQTQHLGFRGQEHMNFSSREEILNRG